MQTSHTFKKLVGRFPLNLIQHVLPAGDNQPVSPQIRVNSASHTQHHNPGKFLAVSQANQFTPVCYTCWSLCWTPPTEYNLLGSLPFKAPEQQGKHFPTILQLNPGIGNGNTPVSLLENPMDRGAWWVIVGYSPGCRKKSDTDERESGTHTVHLKEFSSEP